MWTQTVTNASPYAADLALGVEPAIEADGERRLIQTVHGGGYGLREL